MIPIRFTRACAPYHAGEVAAFPEATAAYYVTKGLGARVELQKPEVEAETKGKGKGTQADKA